MTDATTVGRDLRAELLRTSYRPITLQHSCSDKHFNYYILTS